MNTLVLFLFLRAKVCEDACPVFITALLIISSKLHAIFNNKTYALIFGS